MRTKHTKLVTIIILLVLMKESFQALPRLKKLSEEDGEDESDKEMKEIYSKICSDKTLSKKKKLADDYPTLGVYTKEMSQNNAIVSFLEENSDGISNIVDEFAFWLVCIIFSFVIFISWIVFLCCFCFSCCMFDKKRDKRSSYKWGYTTTFGVMNLIIVLSCFVGFAKVAPLGNAIDESTCSFTSFFYDFLHGVNISETKRWYGTKNLVNDINAVKQDMFDFSENEAEISSLPNIDYMELIEQLEVKYNDTEKAVNPVNQTPDPTLYSYHEEIEELMRNVKVDLESVKDNTQFAQDITDLLKKGTSGSSGLTSSIESVTSVLEDITGLVNDLYDSFGNVIVDVRDLAKKYIILVFKIIFSFFFVCSVGLIVSFVMFAFLKIKFFKVIFHIFWILEIFFAFGSLLLGAILGFIGSIGNEIGGVIGYVFSEDYLKNSSFDISSDIVDKANICLNGDGDLATGLDFGTNMVFGKLEDLVNEKDERMKNANTTVKATSHIDLINRLEELSSGENFKEIISEDKQMVGDCLEMLGVDESTAKTMSCNVNSYDEEEKSCCIFIQTAYKHISAIKEKAIAYKEDFLAKGQQTKANLDKINSCISGMIASIKSLGKKINAMFNSMNCQFLSKDLVFFIDSFCNSFGEVCLSLGYACCAACIAAYISIYFIGAIYYWAEDENTNGGQKAVDCSEKMKPTNEVMNSERPLKEEPYVSNGLVAETNSGVNVYSHNPNAYQVIQPVIPPMGPPLVMPPMGPPPGMPPMGPPPGMPPMGPPPGMPPMGPPPGMPPMGPPPGMPPYGY